jgi:general secretion pathway protein D
MFSEETNGGEVRTPRSPRSSPEAAAPVNAVDTSGQGFSVAGGAIGSTPVQTSFSSERLQETPPREDSSNPTQPTQPTRIGVGRDGEPRIKIVSDASQNALLILAAKDDYRRVERVIAMLDVLPNQVLIEATIAEVTLNDDLRFGVRWFFENKSGSKRAVFSDLVSGAVASAFPGFSFAAKTVNGSQVTLNALNEVGRVNVLASPSLMVLDKKTATLQIGNEVPITTQSAQSVLTPGAPIVNSIAYKNTGVILDVTPRINVSGRILLDIEQEVSTVSRTDTSNIDSPTFGRRKVRTSVVVNDGESITLGGLIQDRTTHVETQVPVLGELPIIGNAFKDKQDTIEKTELIIMLTPRVVRDLNEAREVTDEYRSKIESLIPTREPFHKALHKIKRVIE